MYEKGRKYIIATALMVLMATGLATAVRPGEIHPLNATNAITYTNPLAINASTTTTLQPTPQLIGGQTDSHGCLIPAGFSWNETAKMCMRSNGDIQLAGGSVMVNMSDPNWKEKLTMPVAISTDIKCVDSDGGKDYFTAGKVYVYDENPKIDSCVRHRFLREWYCSGDTSVSTFVVCKKGCKAGACLPENPVTTTTVTSTTSTTASTTTTLKSG